MERCLYRFKDTNFKAIHKRKIPEEDILILLGLLFLPPQKKADHHAYYIDTIFRGQQYLLNLNL